MRHGDHTYGTHHIICYQWGEGAELIIGKYCSIAENIKVFLGGTHNPENISTYPFRAKFDAQDASDNNITKGNVIIGNDVYICHGVTIMSGLTIGDGAIIAANSHVIKDVPPYSITGGNPAKHIKYRFSEDIVQLLMELKWWDLPDEKVKGIAKTLSSKPIYEEVLSLVNKFRRQC